jgi:hypothetical protein
VRRGIEGALLTDKKTMIRRPFAEDAPNGQLANKTSEKSKKPLSQNALNQGVSKRQVLTGVF